MNPDSRKASVAGADGADKDVAPPARSQGSRPKRLIAGLATAAGGALIALLGVAGLFLWSAGQDHHAELPVISAAPQYHLVNQNGKSISSQDFAGKVQIVTPLFPYCRELCPLIAANLAEFHDNVVPLTNLKGHIAFVFFNVAPADAGPKAMREFLKQYGWNPDDPSVQYLTGSPDEIKRVVQQGYHIAYYRTQGDKGKEGSPIRIDNALADRVKPDFDVIHAGTIEVVDGAGRIRKIFTDGTRVDDTDLLSAITPLLSNQSVINAKAGE